jgi:hypothetical protein
MVVVALKWDLHSTKQLSDASMSVYSKMEKSSNNGKMFQAAW